MLFVRGLSTALIVLALAHTTHGLEIRFDTRARVRARRRIVKTETPSE